MKFYCIKQHDITDCAAACLATIASQYGLKVPISKIREVAGTDKQGTNFVIARLIQYNQENKSAVYVASSIICFSLAIFASNILWALGVSDFLTWGIGLILLIIDNVFAPADRTIAGASWLVGFISSISFLHNFWVNVLVGLGLILIATLINICLVKVMEGKQLNAFIVKITNSQILIK